jgi:hypothetical protein
MEMVDRLVKQRAGSFSHHIPHRAGKHDDTTQIEEGDVKWTLLLVPRDTIFWGLGLVD